MKNIILSLFLACLLAGCGATSSFIQKDDQESLSKSTDLYYKLLMWKYYEKAAKFVDPDKMGEYESFVLRNEKDLNITSYEIKDIVYILDDQQETKDKDNEASECQVRVLFGYYKYPSVSEKSVMVQDTWIKIGKVWYVSSDYEEGTFK